MSELGSDQKDSLIDRNLQSDVLSQDNNLLQTPMNRQQNQLLNVSPNKKSEFAGLPKVNQFGEVMDITKSVVVNKKLYTYIGKPHPEIIQLFELLEKNAEKESSFKIINYMRRKLDELEDFFDKKCIFFRGRMKISLYEFISYIFFIAIYIVYAVNMSQMTDELQIKRTEWKSELIGNQILFGAVFTVYGIIYINIKSLFVLILLFLTLVVLQIFLLLNDLGILTGSGLTQPSYSTLFSRGYPIVLYLHWFIFSVVYNWIKKQFRRSSSMFFAIGWCLLLPYFVCLQVLSYVLLEKDYNTFTLLNNILSILLTPVIIMIAVSWILLHYRLFMLPLSHIATAIARIKEDLKNNFKQPIPVDDNEDEEDPQQKKLRSCWMKFKKWFRQNLYLISSSIIGGIYIFCEVYLFYQVMDQFKQDTVNYDNIAILIFQIIIIPAFIILGIVISVSNRQVWMTYTFFPLFVAAFPLFGIIPLSSLLQNTSFGGNLTYVAIIALPTIVVYWLVLALFGVQKRFKFLLFISYTCIFFAFPIGFLLPFSYGDLNGLDASTVYLIAGIIIATGVGILLLYLVYFIIKLLYISIFKRKAKEIMDLTVISYYNLKNMGFLVNSSGFIFGYTLICYVFYARPDTASNDDRGFIDGMLVILPLLFLLMNYALEQQSLEIIVEEDNLSVDASVTQSQISKSQIVSNNDYQDKMQKLQFQKRVIYGGILIPFFVALPLYLLSSERQNSMRIFSIMIGFPISFVIFWFLISIKNKSKKFQNFFTPFLISICWCCLIFPMFIIAPIISSYIETQGEYFAEFMRGIVASVAIILICGVTSFSIFIFVIKNQLEQEKKKKFVITQMLKTCIENRVKSTANPMAVLYDHFQKIQLNEDKMKYILQNNYKPLRYDKKRPKSKDFEEAIVISRNMQSEKKQEPVINKRSKFDIFLDYAFCRFGIQVDDLNKNRDDDGEKTIDEISQEVERVEEIMDDYLPKQLKKGYLYQQYESKAEEEENVNLMQHVEQTKEQKAIELFEDTKIKVKSKQDQISSKTFKFRSYKLQKITAQDINKFKYTDYGSLIYNSEFERGVFFHDLYKDFANEDDNLPESMIYNDFLELCRLSGILEINDDYTSQIQQQELPTLREKQDSIPSDLQSFDDLDFDQLTQKELSQIYDAHATMFWKGGILALSIENFSSCMIDIANKLSTKKESKNATLKLRELLYERMYGYLVINIPSFASNYRPDVRKFMKKDEIAQRMEGSPFLLTVIPFQEESDKDDEKIFDYTKRGKFLMSMQKENNLELTNIQLNYSSKQGNGKGKEQAKVQDQEISKKPKEKVSCFIMICRCLRSCCCLVPLGAIQYVNNKINNIIQRLTKPKITNKLARKPQVKKAPNWQDMSDNLVSSMALAIKAYEENQKQAQNVQFNWNINNIMTLFGKVSDFLTLYGVAFNNSVEWLPGVSTKVDTGIVTSGGIFSNFINVYWVCFAFGIIYFFLAIIAQQYAEKGTLGKDENGDNANFKHRQFYLSKGVNFLGSSQFMFIMRTYIDTYICDWESAAPWPLYRTKDIVCVSDTHLLMMGLGFISLLAYYPLSTFIQPGIQFLDNTLDVKYDKSYVAVYIQAKLIVLGATSFFNSFSNKHLISIIQLSVTSFIGFGMAILAIKIQPCLISLVNPIEIGCLLAIGIVRKCLKINGVGLIIVITKQALAGFILNIVLHLIVIGCVAYIIKKRLGQLKKQPKKIVLNHLPIIKKAQDRQKEQEQFKKEVVIESLSPSVSKRGIQQEDISQSIQKRPIQKNLKQVEQSDIDSKFTEQILIQ